MANLRLCPEYSRRIERDFTAYLLERNGVQCWFVSDYEDQWIDFFEEEYWLLEDRVDVAESIDELPIAIPSTFILWGV